jgi:hypothetical protein
MAQMIRIGVSKKPPTNKELAAYKLHMLSIITHEVELE